MKSKNLLTNSMYNLVGLGGPIIVAIFSLPILVSSMGAERLGVLFIAWLFIGYFSIFDFGLGRVLTKLISEKNSKYEHKDVPDLIFTAMTMMMGMGILGGSLLIMTSYYLTYDILNITPHLRRETMLSLIVIGVCIPFITTAAGLRGILEANNKFFGINVIRFFLGVSSYLLPVVLYYLFNSLTIIIIGLSCARVMSWLAQLVLCVRLYPGVFKSLKYQKKYNKVLISFGGWMTVANLTAPLLVYLDKFIIASFLSISLLSYYSVPYDMATKLWILPGAMVGTLLPIFTASLVTSRANTSKQFYFVTSIIGVVMFPICLTIITFSEPLLNLWLGLEFSQNSSIVLELIVAGVFINSLAQVSFVLMQAHGRADITAKILLLEIPFYIIILILLTRQYGIYGSAIAWVIRVAVDEYLLSRAVFEYGEYMKVGIIKYHTISIISLFVLLFPIIYRESLNKELYCGVGLLIYTILILSNSGKIKENFSYINK